MIIFASIACAQTFALPDYENGSYFCQPSRRAATRDNKVTGRRSSVLFSDSRTAKLPMFGKPNTGTHTFKNKSL
jgi:hypothetical protein